MGRFGDYNTLDEVADEVAKGALQLWMDYQDSIVWTVEMRTLTETGKEVPVICCCLFQGTMYKPMDETEHPYYFRCPVWWLDRYPDPCLGLSTQWREEVRKRQGSQSPNILEGPKKHQYTLTRANGTTMTITQEQFDKVNSLATEYEVPFRDLIEAAHIPPLDTCVMVPVGSVSGKGNLWIGIEKDGYAHT